MSLACSRVARLAALVLFVSPVGCGGGSKGPSRPAPCSTSADCAASEVCLDGHCAAPPEAGPPLDAAAGDSGTSDAGTDAGPSCQAGETVCGAACITGTDCTHAVTTDMPASANVFVNGATFRELTTGATSDVTAVHVADARVAFRAADATHLWIEVPPGVVGPADVTLHTAMGDVITRRALTYRSAPEGTSWTRKTMSAARGGFPAMATTFDDRVLVGGGYTVPAISACTDTADLFDRNTETSTPAANTMSTKRWTATATTVLDGETIVAGGCYSPGCIYDATLIDRFDPTTNSFTPASGTLQVSRGFLRALRLADDRILYASDETPHFEIYDPEADVSTVVTGGDFSMYTPLTGQMARLRDGRVLIVPGGGGPVSIFDPSTMTFTPTGDALPQYPDGLVALGDGRIFAVGGFTGTPATGNPTMLTTSDVIDVFDPATEHFSPFGATLATSRFASTVILGRDGRIYDIGGASGTVPNPMTCASDADVAGLTFQSSVEIIDPAAGTVTAGPSLPEANLSLRSTILFDGSIIAGGGTPCGSHVMSYASVYFLEAPLM